MGTGEVGNGCRQARGVEGGARGAPKRQGGRGELHIMCKWHVMCRWHVQVMCRFHVQVP